MHIVLQSSAFFLFFLSLPLMSTHSFKNLSFPINHFFLGPGRWPFAETSLIVATNLFSLSPSPNIIIISQLFSTDIPILHPSICPLPYLHTCISCLLHHCSFSHYFQPFCIQTCRGMFSAWYVPTLYAFPFSYLVQLD